MKLKLFSVFHLNLYYSSIAEEQRLQVINNCYWPLLRLVKEHGIPLGIEASGMTLQAIAELNPLWIKELGKLLENKSCEFVGSGYAQIAGPLVPAKVNEYNLQFGKEIYRKLLGVEPELALLNEQAYSAGILEHYVKAGFKAIVMEWENPRNAHPEWNPEYAFLPQLCCDHHGKELPIIWNHSLSFQKFQRFAHGELEHDEYLSYLVSQCGETERVFPVYGNDAEIFDFRPGRFATERPLTEKKEWQRIETFYDAIANDSRFQLILPREVLNSLVQDRAGQRLQLESAAIPIPVKKQGKYNIARWAVTGVNDLSINTSCYRIYRRLKDNGSQKQWRNLCYLWSSDFRTHIEQQRWQAYLRKLRKIEKQTNVVLKKQTVLAKPTVNIGKQIVSGIVIKRQGRFLRIKTSQIDLGLNCQKGLSIDKLIFYRLSKKWLCGSLPHGFYHDINWSADFFSGHMVFEAPGTARVTDLESVEPVISQDYREQRIIIQANIVVPLGIISKCIIIRPDSAQIDFQYSLAWPRIPLGSLRIGHIMLNPNAFQRETLLYRTQNGGCQPETFFINTRVGHSDAVSFLVSAQQGIGLTEGVLEIGDAQKLIKVKIDKSCSAAIGLIKFESIKDSYLYRAILSVQEADDTSLIRKNKKIRKRQPLVIKYSIVAGNE